MNFQIVNDNFGKGTAFWEWSEGIQNNVYILLNIKKGTFLQDLDMGFDKTGLDVITSKTAALLKNRIEQALQPMIDGGRADSVTVKVEQDTGNHSRMNVEISVPQFEGVGMQFVAFVFVGGGSSGFIFP